MWYPNERLIRFYIHNRNLYAKGYGEYAVVKQLFSVQTVMVLWLFLRNIWPELPNLIVGIAIPVIIIGRMVVGWSVGWWWNRYKLFDRESDWANDRNLAMRKIINGDG